jgi:hypothetical protein
MNGSLSQVLGLAIAISENEEKLGKVANVLNRLGITGAAPSTASTVGSSVLSKLKSLGGGSTPAKPATTTPRPSSDWFVGTDEELDAAVADLDPRVFGNKYATITYDGEESELDALFSGAETDIFE